jgi:hypothetical protein
MPELKLKAYIAYAKGCEDEWIYVYALNPSQAKAIARERELFEDTDYTDIRVERMPKLDKVFRVDSENAFLAYDRGEYRVAYKEG